jgi:hypothetical protein
MLDRLWSYRTHHWPDVFLADADQCFVTARKTRLVCLDLFSGTEVWSAKVKSPWASWGWLAVTPSRVFHLTQHSTLVSYSRKDGQVLWSCTLRGFYGWLHANENTVIVGGWRGYTDVLCLDPSSGEEKWRYAALKKQIHSTRIHHETHTLLVAEAEAESQLKFLDLETGALTQALKAPGRWTSHQCGNPPPTRGTILEADDCSFYRLVGSTPVLEKMVVPWKIWSKNLEEIDGIVPFINDRGELVAYSLAEQKGQLLGPITHNRRDFLPFATLSNSVYAIGTSIGLIYVFSTDGSLLAKQKMGKSICSGLAQHEGGLVFASGSGQILKMSFSNNE